jgi:hypothetical protein
VYDIHGKNNVFIEDIIESVGVHNVGAIIFDMLDNVKFPLRTDAREDQRLEQLYQWSRELGVRCDCPVFPTSQISNEGAGLLFQTENMLKDSKTGKQGACDGIIMIGSSDDDLKILLAKRFLLSFDTGIVVIKHWRLHNYIAKDRYTETIYKEEKQKLFTKENGSYTDHAENVPIPYTGCIQDDDTGKVSKGKVSKVISKEVPTTQEVEDYILSKQLVVTPQDFINWYDNTGWTDNKGKPILNWKNKIQNWNRRELEKRPTAKPYSKTIQQSSEIFKCSCGGQIIYGQCKNCAKLYDGVGNEIL